MAGTTTKSTRFELRVPNDLFERLKTEAAQAGVSMAGLVLARAAGGLSKPDLAVMKRQMGQLVKAREKEEHEEHAAPAKREVRVVEPAKRVVQVKRVKPLVASVVRGKAPTEFPRREVHLRGQPSTKDKK